MVAEFVYGFRKRGKKFFFPAPPVFGKSSEMREEEPTKLNDDDDDGLMLGSKTRLFLLQMLVQYKPPNFPINWMSQCAVELQKVTKVCTNTALPILVSLGAHYR